MPVAENIGSDPNAPRRFVTAMAPRPTAQATTAGTQARFKTDAVAVRMVCTNFLL
ncbi:hypothetical protein MA6G0728R_4908 [Mycobacteroides abscessus 6G-0728-R]|uniref:Uncharacterized protein n=1 Tax=Mycobacteroides abscessus 1948 TaxID=1299323 RepID=A0A829QLD9_9MYCO|nr:hypothetical protein MA4S0303_4662 [Mycobacteroides abscessus 4S-0303]EIT92856.1 hypothetical protein MA4S0726RB_4192 [Mycobacteroides abscessus 4S-0726-RB]EIT96401.1 hypothetical protein MA4S0726RA_4598 [Mycobacteroides abscessus 4S-0726-RA]EIU37526.1 hypothetical protein MA6G0125S_4977 [Mycobacteroides abscessus 6G-0125-S]EIU40176.1 hypothetical protein MA6G0125R_3938 [Mycobacteroides abscessus 6G-0125-R]EIU52434.1 hypothetical protein MA6G1108_4906 [Mycobacteroides abscessus 6G-1108]EIU